MPLSFLVMLLIVFPACACEMNDGLPASGHDSGKIRAEVNHTEADTESDSQAPITVQIAASGVSDQAVTSPQSGSTKKTVATAPEKNTAGAAPEAEEKTRPVSALDMDTLVTRLKQTKAIGFFTKLAIRNDVVDLTDLINSYRKKSLLNAKLEYIRTRFDGLFLKIVALLENDPGLSRDIYLARETIWKSLLEVKA